MREFIPRGTSTPLCRGADLAENGKSRFIEHFSRRGDENLVSMMWISVD
jgi:hypothetical protein